MNKVDELLEYVQKTNAEMTREKILEELGRNPASTIINFVFLILW